MSWFFTADEHYGHKSIIEYCKRPFAHVDEMNEVLVNRHNEVVGSDDTTVHVGDFSLIKNRGSVEAFIHRLNGNHVFIKGSHDYWLAKNPIGIEVPIVEIWEKEFKTELGKFYIVACHYAMRTWPGASHGSWQLYGHSHGAMPGIGPQMDVGVDTNNFYPYSLEDVIKIIRKRPAFDGCHHGEKKRLNYG